MFRRFGVQEPVGLGVWRNVWIGNFSGTSSALGADSLSDPGAHFSFFSEAACCRAVGGFSFFA